MPRGIKKVADTATEQRIDSGASLADNKPEERDTNPQRGTGESVSGGGIPTISPIDLATGTGAGSPSDDGGSSTGSARRGRKPGTKNRATTQGQTAEDLIVDLTATIMVFNGFLAAATGVQEFDADEETVKKAADSYKALLAAMSVNLNPLTVARIRALTATGCMYGPALVAIWMRPRKEKEPLRIVQPPAAQPSAAKSTPIREVSLRDLTPSQLDPSEPIESFGE